MTSHALQDGGAPTPLRRLRVMTYNVLRGATGREPQVREVVRAIRPDVAVFTEARGTAAFEAITREVGDYHVRSGAAPSRDSVLIASRWPVLASDRFGPAWAPSKWVRATIRPFGGPALHVAGVHLVPQPLWLCEALRALEVGTLLAQAADGRHLIAGDFNSIAPGDAHHLSRAAWHVRAQWRLQAGVVPRWSLRRVSRAGYVDCYRARRPLCDGFTVPARDPHARLDFLFASPSLARTLCAAGRREPATAVDIDASDHLAVWADFEWPAAV